ncbi:MAG: hypothetical protein Harvfovirus34_10 [Harvfovirus sp.]|uniref:Uncharacterized protein n=1 Tax=Harvfovirus sp. TaxID=2487768 RepID=A0A3G5A2M3_9VIRU|nr:MAG: hypothetical protein Harvfovirus34_10 [Harvfovirus sp.]
MAAKTISVEDELRAQLAEMEKKNISLLEENAKFHAISKMMTTIRERFYLSKLILNSFVDYCVEVNQNEGCIFGSFLTAMLTLSTGSLPKTLGKNIELALGQWEKSRYITKFDQFDADYKFYTSAMKKFGKSTNIKFGPYELVSVELIQVPLHFKLIFRSSIDCVTTLLYAWQPPSTDFSAKSFILRENSLSLYDKHVTTFDDLYELAAGLTHITYTSKKIEPDKLFDYLCFLAEYHGKLNDIEEEFGLILCGDIPVMRTGVNSEMIGIEGKFLEIGLDCNDPKCRKKCSECKDQCVKKEHVCTYLPINTLVGMCIPAIKKKEQVRCPYCKEPIRILFTTVTPGPKVESVNLSIESLLSSFRTEDRKEVEQSGEDVFRICLSESILDDEDEDLFL